MFKKNHCSRCKRQLKKDFEFCPYCGASQNQNNKWGMLGKNDSLETSREVNDPFSPLFPGGMGKGILNKMIGNAMKMVEKELQREMQKQNQNQNPNLNPENSKRINLRPNTKLQLFVNGKKIDLNGTGIQNPMQKTPKKKIKKAPKKSITKEFTQKMKKKFSSLPKEEPNTNLRRLSNKIIYEIGLPEVKSINAVAIRSLEKSIEIKAVSKTKAYYKIIPVDLPLLNYNLKKDFLILELEAKN